MSGAFTCVAMVNYYYEGSSRRETEALGIKSRRYSVGGRVDVTLADETGAEVKLTASF